ncbi:hypothetical protein R6Q57_011623 [Mikania cordata]
MPTNQLIVEIEEPTIDLDAVIPDIPFLQPDNVQKITEETNPEEKTPVLKIRFQYKKCPREKYISEQLRSPYVERSVVLGSKLIRDETIISQYILDPRKYPHTLLFMTNSDTEFYKVMFESLYPGVYLHIGVLEGMMHVLNEEEKQRAPGSPFRLFLTPNILRDVFVNYLLDNDHPNAYKLHQQTQKIIDLPWKTTQNGVDCGVFCMRNMETYMGGDIKGCKYGLLHESEA